jgi:hypothetical protein
VRPLPICRAYPASAFREHWEPRLPVKSSPCSEVTESGRSTALSTASSDSRTGSGHSLQFSHHLDCLHHSLFFARPNPCHHKSINMKIRMTSASASFGPCELCSQPWYGRLTGCNECPKFHRLMWVSAQTRYAVRHKFEARLGDTRGMHQTGEIVAGKHWWILCRRRAQRRVVHCFLLCLF